MLPYIVLHCALLFRFTGKKMSLRHGDEYLCHQIRMRDPSVRPLAHGDFPSKYYVVIGGLFCSRMPVSLSYDGLAGVLILMLSKLNLTKWLSSCTAHAWKALAATAATCPNICGPLDRATLSMRTVWLSTSQIQQVVQIGALLRPLSN
jgi:hypothetical protein